jgi:hypothetical protein
MSTARPRVRPLADLLRLFVAPGVWFAHFTVVYGAEALICTPPVTGRGVMIWTGAAATVLALAALVAFAFMQSRPADRTEHTGAAFLHDAALLLALLSGLGVMWTAFPLAVLSFCASPAG